MDLRSYIRDVPDFPKKGILFRDITPLLASPGAFAESISQFKKVAYDLHPDLVAGIESRGFLFGTPLAQELAAGFIPIRKPGKLPWQTIRAEYSLEYGTDAVEMHKDAAGPGQRVIVVDDLLATGGTVEAACRLVEEAGAEVAACLFLVELTDLGGRERVASFPVESLVQF